MKNTELSQWLTDYDLGKEVETVEMGGMGEGYERAIQELAIATMRRLQLVSPPKEDKVFSDLITLCEDEAFAEDGFRHKGMSGAQAGASRNIAAVFYKQTPNGGLAMMRDIDHGRILKIKQVDGKLVFLSEVKG